MQNWESVLVVPGQMQVGGEDADQGEEGITEQDNSRIDLLAELIQLRRTYGADPCLAEDLTALINWHSQMDRRLADEQLRVVL